MAEYETKDITYLIIEMQNEDITNKYYSDRQNRELEMLKFRQEEHNEVANQHPNMTNITTKLENNIEENLHPIRQSLLSLKSNQPNQESSDFFETDSEYSATSPAEINECSIILAGINSYDKHDHDFSRNSIEKISHEQEDSLTELFNDYAPDDPGENLHRREIDTFNYEPRKSLLEEKDLFIGLEWALNNFGDKEGEYKDFNKKSLKSSITDNNEFSKSDESTSHNTRQSYDISNRPLIHTSVQTMIEAELQPEVNHQASNKEEDLKRTIDLQRKELQLNSCQSQEISKLRKIIEEKDDLLCLKDDQIKEQKLKISKLNDQILSAKRVIVSLGQNSLIDDKSPELSKNITNSKIKETRLDCNESVQSYDSSEINFKNNKQPTENPRLLIPEMITKGVNINTGEPSRVLTPESSPIIHETECQPPNILLANRSPQIKENFNVINKKKYTESLEISNLEKKGNSPQSAKPLIPKRTDSIAKIKIPSGSLLNPFSETGTPIISNIEPKEGGRGSKCSKDFSISPIRNPKIDTNSNDRESSMKFFVRSSLKDSCDFYLNRRDSKTAKVENGNSMNDLKNEHKNERNAEIEKRYINGKGHNLKPALGGMELLNYIYENIENIVDENSLKNIKTSIEVSGGKSNDFENPLLKPEFLP